MSEFRYPTAEELSALERAARRARAEAVARLAKAAAASIKSLFAPRATAPAGRYAKLEL